MYNQDSNWTRPFILGSFRVRILLPTSIQVPTKTGRELVLPRMDKHFLFFYVEIHRESVHFVWVEFMYCYYAG